MVIDCATIFRLFVISPRGYTERQTSVGCGESNATMMLFPGDRGGILPEQSHGLINRKMLN